MWKADLIWFDLPIYENMDKTLFKLSEIILLHQALQRLGQQAMPIAVSFQILRFTQMLTVEASVVEKARLKLFEKYGTFNQASNEWTVRPEMVEAFTEEHTALVDQEIDLAAPVLKISDFGDIRISAHDLKVLEKLLI